MRTSHMCGSRMSFCCTYFSSRNVKLGDLPSLLLLLFFIHIHFVIFVRAWRVLFIVVAAAPLLRLVHNGTTTTVNVSRKSEPWFLADNIRLNQSVGGKMDFQAKATHTHHALKNTYVNI